MPSRPSLIVVAAMLLAACTSTSALQHESTTPVDPVTTSSSSTSASVASTSSTIANTTSTTTTVAVTIVPPGGLADVAAAAALGPVPAGTKVQGAASDEAVLYHDGCHLASSAVQPKLCVFGDPNSSTVVVVTGDSHAAHWFGAFEEAAKANHWKLVMVTKTGCPAADVSIYKAPTGKVSTAPYPECNAWRKNAMAFILSLHPTVVVFPMLSRRAVIGFKSPALGEWQAGLGRSIAAVAGDGVKVLVLGDTPKTNGLKIPGCVAAHLANVAPCVNSRAKAVLTDHLAAEQAAATEHGALFVDVSDWICSATVCPVVIGGNVVYRDDHHLTDHFSRYRAPQVAAAVELALAGPAAH